MIKGIWVLRFLSLKIFLILFALFFIAACGQEFSGKKAPVAKDAVIDLTDWDFEKDGPVDLKGEWRFFWKKSINESDFLSSGDFKLDDDGLFDMPGIWNGFELPGKSNEALSGSGYASFVTKLKLPEKHNNLAFFLADSLTSYELFLYDSKAFVKVLSNGAFSEVEKNQRPQYLPMVSDKLSYYLSSQSRELTLVFKVSNFFHSEGGPSNSISIGPKKYLDKKLSKSRIRAAALIGLLFVTSFYHFGLFIQRRSDKGSLFFALSCFFMSIIQITNEKFIIYFTEFDGFDFMETHSKLDYISLNLAAYFFFKFISCLVPGKFFQKVVHFIAVVTCLYIILHLLTDISFYSGKPLDLYYLIVFIVLVLCFVHLTKEALGQNKTALYTMLGSLPLIFCVVNDILHDSLIINSVLLMPYGFGLFIFVQSYILSKEFTDAAKKAAYLSRNLQKEVADRTMRLEIAKQSALDSQMLIKLSKDEAVEAKLQIEEQADRLIELDQQKTSFFQNISHELRTPLTLILNPLEEALARYKDDKDLLLARKNSHRLYRLVNQLLDFQKLQAGKKELKLELLDLKKFIEGCADAVRPALKKKSIYLSVELAKEDVFLETELDSLEKIAFNYLSNAIKYTPEKGSICLGIKLMKDDKVRIFVRDSGPGLDKNQQKKLFQIFSQVDETKSRSFEGTGLGLALVKELTEKLGGNYGIESAPGKGANFWVELKIFKGDVTNSAFFDFKAKDWLITDESRAFEASKDSGDSSLESSEAILVVDDLPDMRELIRRCLHEAGFKTFEAESGMKGIKKAKIIKPNLIICDWMMSGMSGIEMLEEVKNDSSLSSIPVILLTAKFDEESRRIGTLKGADAFLGKPFDKDELISTVNNLLRLKKRELETEQELRSASKLQRMLNANLLRSFGGIEVSDFFEPSTEIGGDFLIVKELDEENLFYCAGDISGKGAKASLASIYIKSLIEQEVELQVDLEIDNRSILKSTFLSVNSQVIKTLGGDVFSTFSAGIINLKSKEMLNLNGGHPPKFLISQDRLELIHSKADPIGMNWSGDIAAQLSSHKFEEGQKIVIFSDSVTELRGHKFGRQYLGLGRSAKILKKIYSKNPRIDAKALAKSFLSLTANKKYDDDCSILIISFTGS